MLFKSIQLPERKFKRIKSDNFRDIMPYFPQDVQATHTSNESDLLSLLDDLTNGSLQTNEKYNVLNLMKQKSQKGYLSLLDDEEFIQEIVGTVIDSISNMSMSNQKLLEEEIMAADQSIIDKLRRNLNSDQVVYDTLHFKGVHVPLQQVLTRSTPSLKSFESLMETVQSKRDLIQVAPQILNLLQQWTSGQQQMEVQQTNDEEHSQVMRLWDHLVESFQKVDQSNTKITSDNIVNWINQSSHFLDGQDQAQQELTESSVIRSFQSLIEGVQSEQDLIKVAPQILSLLQQWPSGQQQMEVQQTSDKEHSQIIRLWDHLVESFHKVDQSNSKITSDNIVNWISQSSHFQGGQVAPEQMLIEQAAVIRSFESLMETVQSDQELIKVAPKILNLLQQWTSEHQHINGEQTITEVKQEQSKVLRLWLGLVDSFHKRQKFATKQLYNENAKVTSRDIVKWLKQSLHTSEMTQNASNNLYKGTFSSSTMTPVEQYVIHIQQHASRVPLEQQLMNQFRQVVQTNQFPSLNYGVNQLSIALRPENLGDIFVRFIETNGEMTVKILVTSQVTKQAMEANLHQLKNMFSPHQVIIEKQDNEFEQFVKDDHLFKEKNKDNLSEQQTEENNDQDDEADDKQAQDFHQILNEKV